MHAVCFRLVVTDNNKCTFLGRLPWDNFGSGKLSGRCLLYFFLKALVHRQNQRWCCIRSLQISSKFWDGLHLMLGRGPGCKNMSRYLILGRGVLHVSCTSMRKKIVLLQLTRLISIIRSITYLDHTACHFFFLANPCQKIWLSKCHVTRWQKKKKKVNLHAMCSWVCYVIGGGNVSFLNLIPIAGTSGGKKTGIWDLNIFFPLGGATNHACNIR